jgi:hypothetical protein
MSLWSFELCMWEVLGSGLDAGAKASLSRVANTTNTGRSVLLTDPRPPPELHPTLVLASFFQSQ